MKNFYCFLMAISLCMYSSCSDTISDDSSPPVIEMKFNNAIYPLNPVSRSLSSFETDWENQTHVTLNSGKNANLPWTSTAISNLPVNFSYDILKEDGWKLILHTFSGSSNAQDEGANFMFFHNYRTGYLKVFYYLEPDHNWPNNMGFWAFILNVSHEYLNHQNELAIPMDYNFIKYWMTTNSSITQDVSFTTGWNGFQVQFAYDDANENKTIMQLTAGNSNVSRVAMYGEFSGESAGTLITHGSINPITNLNNDIASVFGESAGNYIDSIFNDSRNTRSVLASLSSGVGGAIVKWGANKIFNKLTAGFSKPTTTITDLSFSTLTKGSLTGTETFPSTAPGGNFSLDLTLSNLGTYLGAWNLASAPTIYLHPLADRTSEYFNGKEYNYKMRGITGYNYDLRINPDLQPYLITHWVEMNVVRYINKGDSVLLNPITNFNYGTLGSKNSGILFNYNRPLNYIYDGDEDGNNKIVEEDMKSVVYAREGLYDRYGQSPTVISVPNEAMYISGDLRYPMEDTYLKFNLFLVTEFEGKRDTTLHTRTFVPKVEWDPVLYNQYSNYSQHEVLPKLEIMEENDSTLLTK